MNEYFGFCFELNFELNHFLARFNEKMNFQNVSPTPNWMWMWDVDAGCRCGMWMWDVDVVYGMWDVDVLKFSGFMDPQMQPLPHVGTLCIETLQNHYHKKPQS